MEDGIGPSNSQFPPNTSCHTRDTHGDITYTTNHKGKGISPGPSYLYIIPIPEIPPPSPLSRTTRPNQEDTPTHETWAPTSHAHSGCPTMAPHEKVVLQTPLILIRLTMTFLLGSQTTLMCKGLVTLTTMSHMPSTSMISIVSYAIQLM